MIAFKYYDKKAKKEDTIYLGSDYKCWMLGKMNLTTKDKKKAVRWDSFYSDLASALRGLLEFKLRMEDVDSVHELQALLKKTKDELNGIYDTEIGN